jgi:hypothetical protein
LVVLDAPDGHRWLVLTATAVAATLASIAVAPIVAGAYAAALLATLRLRTARTAAIVSTIAYGAIAGLWYLVAIRPVSHPALRDYWQRLGAFWTHHGNLGLATGLLVTLKHVADGFSGLDPTLTIWILAAAMVVAFLRSVERALLLVVPFVVAIALAGMRLAPLGARVDIYLYPTFALLVAYAVQPLLDRLTLGWIAPSALLAVLLATTPLPSVYQHEDIRPLVERLEAQARPTDSVLLYPTGRFAFALYTHWPVHIDPSPITPVPFNPVVTHPGFQQLSGGPRLQQIVDNLHRDPTVRRVWFIGSHGLPNSIAAMNRAIERGGFVTYMKVGDHNAWLYEYVRPAR